MGAGNIYIKPIELGSQKVCEPKTYFLDEKYLNSLGYFLDEDELFDWSFEDVCEHLEISLKRKFKEFEFGDQEEVADVFSEYRRSSGILILEEKNGLVKIVATYTDNDRVALGIIPMDFESFTDYAVYYGTEESTAFAEKYGIPEDIDPYEQEGKLIKAYKKFIKDYYNKQANIFEDCLKNSPNFKGYVSYRTSAWTSGRL